MSDDLQLLISRAEAYARLLPTRPGLKRRLGHGTDGVVYESYRATAIKACNSFRAYFNELNTYKHLQERGCPEMLGEFHIPTLKGHHEGLMIVEMDLMSHPPFVVDFGKVRLLNDPDFSDEVLHDAEVRGQELFEANWPRVKTLLADLESYLVYYLDPKPGNIVFEDTLYGE